MERSRATQFLFQKVAIDVQHGNDFIDTGLGRVCLSAHSLSDKTFLLLI